MLRRMLAFVRAQSRLPLQLTFFAALGVSGALLGLSSATASVNWRGDYETGDWSQWGSYHVQTSSGATASIQTGVVRQGHYAAKFTTPASGSRVRSQIYADQETTDGYSGHENWYAWSTMIASGSALRDGYWNNLTSWHQSGSDCPAPMHLVVDGSNRRLYFDTRGGALDTTTCSTPYQKSWSLGTITFGQWYDFVVHVKYSADPAVGFVEIFMNGKRVVPKTHTATLYSGQGVYLKQGYDAGSATGTTTVYNDGTVRAGDYAGAITAFPDGTWPSTPGGSTTTTAASSSSSSSSSTTTSKTTSTTSSTTSSTTTTSDHHRHHDDLHHDDDEQNHGKKGAPPGQEKKKGGSSPRGH